jgi:uncharacterized protein DUF222
VSTVTVPASASEAMDMVHAGLAYLAAADAAAMGAAAQAACLRGLEQANSVATAVRTSVLGAFGAGQGYTDDGAYSPRAWLVHQTAITVGAATGHTGWVKRARAHPRVQAALVAKEVSEPWARTICEWTGKLPEDSRDAADGILLAAAVSGLGLPDLAGLAGEMYERSRQHAPSTDRPGPGPGQDPDHNLGQDQGPGQEQGGNQERDRDPGQGREGSGDQRRDPAEGGQPGELGDLQDPGVNQDPGEDTVLDDRSVRLATTFGGAGVIRGDLTPECAQVVRAVLDALSARAGAEDDRSHEQRYHDALQEAMCRLVAAGLVPERAGQPVKVLAHVTLADLMLLEGSERLREEWTRQARARWAGYKARNAETRGDDGAWLDGSAAAAIACDAQVVPVVTGEVNPAVFADLVRLCAALDKLSRRGAAGTGLAADSSAADSAAGGAAAGTVISREALEQAIVGKAVDLLSGPGGLASFVRQRQLGLRLSGPSLPLDIGVSTTIPAGIRNAVRLRDLHCQWAGGCNQPASACDVHHTKHKAHGGKTSLKDCVLLCRFHHQIVIHRWGWTLVVNPDGTTTAWNKDKTKVLHSHGPPVRAGPGSAPSEQGG